MNIITKHRTRLIVSLALLFASGIHAKVSTASVGQVVGVQAFDSVNGIWYLGTGVANGTSSLVQTNAVFDGSTTPTFTPLAAHADLTTTIFDKRIAINYIPDTTTAVLALHETANNATNVLLYKAGTAAPTKLLVNDGAALGVTAGDIRDFAISPTHAFIATDVSGGNFGATNSGIRCWSFTDAIAITQQNFVSFDIAGAANVWVRGVAAGGNPTIAFAETPRLMWHPGLSRLYAGISGSCNTISGDLFMGLSCWYVATDTLANVPLLENLGAPTALNTNVGLGIASAAGTSNIVGVKSGTDARYIAIRDLAPMTTSTRKNYIIIRGGFGTAAAANLITGANQGKIFALPLCDSSIAIRKGGLAKVTNTISGAVDFNSTADSITGADLYNETSIPAIVGGAALPILATATDAVTQMSVVGDAVFCAIQGNRINGALGTGIEPGLYYSQAIFDNTGTIVKWTDWARAASNSLTGDAADDGSCFAFAIDSARGRTWTIADDAKTIVNVAQWTRPTSTATYGGQINSKLTDGCYSVFNMGQHIANLGNVILNRFCLFGGNSQVVAIKTGAVTAAAFSNPEAATSDWTAATEAAVNLTTGLTDAGPVTALGWMGESATTTDNFLLAGTNKGLYAFASAAGAGFDSDASVNILGAMNHADSIWQTFQWYPLTAITDPVVKIVTVPHTTDSAAYVLTRGATADKIWKIGTNTNLTVTELNTGTIVFGTTGLAGDDFVNAKKIYDIELVTANVTGTLFQLMVSTDIGIFISTVTGGLLEATTATTANFTQITDASHVAYKLSSPLRTRSTQHVWTIDRYYDDAPTGTPAIKTSLGQFGLSNDSETRRFAPVGGFNSNSLVYFNSLNRVTTPLYSNGAYRFMSTRITPHSNSDYSLLSVLPYFVASTETNLTSLTAIPDAACLAANTKAIYWIADVGAGYTMAGTDDGVIVLD